MLVPITDFVKPLIDIVEGKEEHEDELIPRDRILENAIHEFHEMAKSRYTGIVFRDHHWPLLQNDLDDINITIDWVIKMLSKLKYAKQTMSLVERQKMITLLTRMEKWPEA